MHNVYEKTIINTNDQQFNQYKQNEQLSLTLKKKNNTKRPYTYTDGNTGRDLRQAHTVAV